MGALIGEALDERGISQAEFCRLAGVSTKHLNEVLRGKAVTPLSTLDYWAWLLGCRFDFQLVTGLPAPPAAPEESSGEEV
jgi:transcriptional regulator with XRE-family HTH domain